MWIFLSMKPERATKTRFKGLLFVKFGQECQAHGKPQMCVIYNTHPEIWSEGHTGPAKY